MTLRELINIIGFEIDEPAMRKVESQTQAMFERMKSFGEKGMMRVTAPIIGAATMAVNAFTNYNTALALVKLRLGAAGDAAQFTVEQLDQMSRTMSEGTLYQHSDVLKDVSGTLLMFGNINDKVFSRAQSDAIDLAAAMETDLKSSTLLLGKALENPAENMEALGRMAKIKFTPEEKAAAAEMQRVNGIAKAQSYILDILEKRNIKGTARTLAEASSGFKMFRKSLTDLGESFGKILFPYFKKFWGFLSDIMNKLKDMPPDMKDLVIIIGGIAAAIPALAFAIGGLGTAFNATSTAISGIQAALSAPKLLVAFSKFGIFALIVLSVAIAFLYLDDIIGGLMGKRSLTIEFLKEATYWVGELGMSIYNLIKKIPLLGFLLNLREKAAAMTPEQEKRARTMTSAQEEEYATTGKITEPRFLPLGKEAAEAYYKKGDVEAGVRPYKEIQKEREFALEPSPAEMAAGLAPSPAVVAGATQNNEVNVVVNQTLPPGTPAETADAAKGATIDWTKVLFKEELRGALVNFPAQP